MVNEYSVFGNLLGSGGTGLSLIANPGSTVLSLNVDGGYFVAKRSAVMLNMGVVTSDGTSIINLGAGFRHYFANKVPVTAEVGLLTGDLYLFTFGVDVGYSLKLAQNIYLEPNVGYLRFDFANLFVGGFRFSLSL